MTQWDEGIPPVEQSPRTAIDASSPAMARKLAWTLGALSAFAPFSIDTYLPAFPRVALDLGASIGLVEVTLAVFLLGMAIGQILWGILSDRSGRRVALVAGCLIFFLMAIVCAVTHSIGVLIAARLIMGIGGSAGQVVARAIVRDLYEETEAARLYSMMMVVSGMAPIVAPFLGSLLLTYFNWRAIFWFIAAFAALCIAAVLAAIPETLPREARVRTETIDALLSCRRIFTHPGFIGPALMVAFLAGMMFTYIASSSYVFIDIFRVPVFFFGFLFATSSIGFYVGAQSNRWLLRRFSLARDLAPGCSDQPRRGAAAHRLLVGQSRRSAALFRNSLPLPRHCWRDPARRHGHHHAAICRRGWRSLRMAGHSSILSRRLGWRPGGPLSQRLAVAHRHPDRLLFTGCGGDASFFPAPSA